MGIKYCAKHNTHYLADAACWFCETPPDPSFAVELYRDPIEPTVEAIESMQRNVDYWGDRCCKAEAETERVRTALGSVIKHWDEFGPEHGLDETIHHARAALKVEE